MVELKSLPREPLLALEAVLLDLIKKFSGGTITVAELKNSRNPYYADLVSGVFVVRKAAQRIKDKDLRDLTLEFISFDEKETLQATTMRFQKVLEAVIAEQLDDHFVDPSDREEFDEAELAVDEKLEISELLAKARVMTNASRMIENHKRRVCYRISEVENELHKSLSNFQTFIASAEDIAEVVKKYGKALRPIADAVAKARTITKRKVKAYEQIEGPGQLKRLPPPTESE